MKLDSLSSFLLERLRLELPGSKAHEVMRAQPVGTVRPRFNLDVPARKGSVLILLYENEGGVFFPLIKRPEYTGIHSGQISLPGGKAEEGEDAIQTALRETFEEVGVTQEQVKVLGTMTEFHVLPSNFLIVPVVASVSTMPLFIPDPVEVARILHAPLSDVLRVDAHKEKEILVAGQYRLNAPHFLLDDEMVWGATAMMLNEFREILLEYQ